MAVIAALSRFSGDGESTHLPCVRRRLPATLPTAFRVCKCNRRYVCPFMPLLNTLCKRNSLHKLSLLHSTVYIRKELIGGQEPSCLQGYHQHIERTSAYTPPAGLYRPCVHSVGMFVGFCLRISIPISLFGSACACSCALVRSTTCLDTLIVRCMVSCSLVSIQMV